ncbi:MAG: response regulator [Alphaproteobacteria bacterium]
MKRLLVVDDEVEFANFVEAASSTLDFEVVLCHDCKSARKKIRDFKPDILVLDIVMPGEDGIEFLQWFSSEDGKENTKVILVTGFNPHYMEMVEKLSSLSGIDIVTTLQKPVHLSDLRKALSA